VVASTAMTLVYALFSFFDVRSRYRELYPFWRGARASLALRNVAHSMVVTGCALAIQLQQHGVIFLISSSVGLGLVPAFTTTRTLANVFLQAAAIVTGPLVPEMVRLHALREHGKLSDMVRAMWLVTTLPVNLGICLGLPFFEPLYRAWTGGAMAFDARLFAGLALAISLRCLGAPLTALLGGINALGAQVWLALAQSALVIGGLWVWLPEAGLAAAGAALALGELFGSVLLPIVWMRRLEPGVMQGLPLRTLATCALPTAVVGLAVAGLARGLPALLVMGVALAVSGLLYSLQWSELGRPMQRRLLALVRLRASTEQA
jgi:O-antigen/teichoic acid export membrane protein